MKKNETSRSGPGDARDALVERALPPLLRFARGRLPRWARGMTDTRDLVHDAVVRVLPRLESFEDQAPGSLEAFLRRVVANQIVDEIRKARRRGVAVVDAPELLRDCSTPGPLANAIMRQQRAGVRRALADLSPTDRALLARRFGAEQAYADVARQTGKPTANAARAAVERAIARVAKATAQRPAADEPRPREQRAPKRP